MIDDRNRLISMSSPTSPPACILSNRILHTIYAYGKCVRAIHISADSNVRSSVAAHACVRTFSVLMRPITKCVLIERTLLNAVLALVFAISV